MACHATQVRVRYIETDQGGVVYHANYLVWFEVGRTEFLRELGFPYSEMESAGFSLTVVETHVNHRFPAHYDEALRVETEFVELRTVRLRVATRIVHEESGRLLADGWVWLAALDASGKVAAFPEQIRDVLKVGISRKEST